MYLPLHHNIPVLRAKAMIEDIILQLRRAGEETFLLPFGDAVSQAVSTDQGPGNDRVAAEIDNIERSLRHTAGEIDKLLAFAAQTAPKSGVGVEEKQEADEGRLTGEDLNFLNEIADILPSITDSLLECSGGCKSGELSLEEISTRVATAAMIVSRGTARFLPPSTPEL
jgi:hypothetical protein